VPIRLGGRHEHRANAHAFKDTSFAPTLGGPYRGVRLRIGQPVTATPSGTSPAVTALPTAPVATVIGTTSLTFESTTQAVVPSGLNPTAYAPARSR
jgi:hypothetical protein